MSEQDPNDWLAKQTPDPQAWLASQGETPQAKSAWLTGYSTKTWGRNPETQEEAEQALSAYGARNEPNPNAWLKAQSGTSAPGHAASAPVVRPSRSGEVVTPPGEPETPTAPVYPGHNLGWVGRQAVEFATEIPKQIAGIPQALFAPVPVAKSQQGQHNLFPAAPIVPSGQMLAGMLAGEPGAKAYQSGSLAPLAEEPGKSLANLLFNLNQARMLGTAGLYAGLRKVGPYLPGQARIGADLESVAGTTTRSAKEGWAGPPVADITPTGPRAQTAFPWGEEELAQQRTGTQFKKTEDTGPVMPAPPAPLKAAQEDHALLSQLARDARDAGYTAQVKVISQMLKDKTKEVSDLTERLGPLAAEYKLARQQWDQTFGALDVQNPASKELSKTRLAAMKSAQGAELPGLGDQTLAEFMSGQPGQAAQVLSDKLRSGDLYKELQEAGIWDKERSLEAFRQEVGIPPGIGLGQTEMAFLRDPGVRGVGVVKDVLVMDEALRAGSGAYGPLQTIRTVTPKTWAEQLVKSGLPGYRLTSELRSQAYEYEANSGRILPDLVAQETRQLKEQLGGQSWAYEYFTNPKTRADIDDLYAGSSGQAILKQLYGKVQDDGQRLSALGLVNQTPEFMQNYITQSHMKLFEIPGWRPPQGIIDRFINNVQAATRLNGRELSVSQAREIAESIIRQRPAEFSYGQGAHRVFTTPGGPSVKVLLNRQNLPDWVKDMYGPLPPGPTGYGFTRMEQSRLLLFDTFAEHLEQYEIPTLQGPARAVVDSPVAGYTQLPHTDRSWGRLAGKYVQDDIVPVLRLLTETSQRAITARILDYSKRMWVVANVPSWIRYAFGNLSFITLGSGWPNPMKAGEMAAAAKAMKDVAMWGFSKTMPPGMQQLLEKGAFAGLPVGTSGDIVGFSRENSFRKFVQENYHDLLSMPDEKLPQVPFERIVSGVLPAPVQSMFAKVYQGVNTSAQQGFLMSHMYARVLNAYVLQARGLSLDQAMNEIAKWHPFYMIPSPLGATLKGITPIEPVIPGMPKLNSALAQIGGALGSPVPSFNMESIRIYELALRKKPFHLAAIHGIPLMFNAMTSAMATGKPSGLIDVEDSLPKKGFSNAAQRLHLLVPSQKGLSYVDLDNVIPGGRMMSDPVAEMLGNPVIPAIQEMIHNVDQMTGQPVVKPGESWPEVWAKRLAERFTVPPMISQLMRDPQLAAEYGVNRRLGAEYEETPAGAAAHDVLGFLYGGIPVQDLERAKQVGDVRDIKGLVKELKTQGLSHAQTESQKEHRKLNILEELQKPR